CVDLLDVLHRPRGRDHRPVRHVREAARPDPRRGHRVQPVAEVEPTMEPHRNANSREAAPRGTRLQFGVGTMLAATAVMALLFGAVRAMGASGWGAALVLAVIALAFLLAVGLVVLIARSGADGQS